MRSYHQSVRDRRPVYGVDPWKIVEKDFSLANHHHSESIFTLGNGYQGIRGTFEEGLRGCESTPGIYINGLYYSKRYIYEEGVPREPKEGQTLINLTDWTPIIPVVHGEELHLPSSEILDYSRTLSLKEGTLLRTIKWKTNSGHILELSILRLVSLTRRHLSIIAYSITPVNFSGWIQLSSLLDEHVSNQHHLQSEEVMEVAERFFAPCEHGLCITQKIKNPSTLHSTAMVNRLEHNSKYEVERISNRGQGYRFHLYLVEREVTTLYKYVYNITSREIDGQDPTQYAMRGAKSAAKRGYHPHIEEQRDSLDLFWERSDVEITGDRALQQGIRYNLFQLLQSTGRDGDTSVAAKGLSGEFYEGHTFWDAEIYIHPFFLFTCPEVARGLLSYRYKILDKSRENARRFKNRGALFAWRTINGEEASAYFMGSSVQCHINAAVAYAIKMYHLVTGDDRFLLESGAEILFETARFWRDRGYFSPHHDGSFVLHVVCGPDEYKPGVNNNSYTNYMASFNLEYAVEVSGYLKERYPKEYEELRERLDLKEEEILQWEEASEGMYLPFHEELGIHPQDDSFLLKEPLDVDALTWEDIPLVRNWHPLLIWRYQVIKQADVILLLFLLGDRFTLEEKRANFHYYEPLTTHDSSLSPSIYSILAAEIGYLDYASSYFRQTVRLDLDDYNGNTWQGLHMAALGSSWMVVVFGFAGLRLSNGTLSFNPQRLEEITRYGFKVSFQGHLLHVVVQREKVTYQVVEGGGFSIYHRGEPLHVSDSPLMVK